jgi:hypothetical protein
MEQVPAPGKKNNQGHADNSGTTLGEAVMRLLPKDHYGAVMTIGMIAGICYYITSHDSWLLTTFLCIMFGTSIEKNRNRRGPVG